MKKSEFEEIKESYEREKERLEKISVGDLVWEVVPRSGDIDFHPAVVKSINVDEAYVDVIDVSHYNNEERRYGYLEFETELEMMQKGLSKKMIAEEKKKYKEIIKKVLDST